jgi:hypothetical protein
MRFRLFGINKQFAILISRTKSEMKRITVLSALIYVVLFFFNAETTCAQAEARYKAGKMIEISDLLSTEETEDCAAKRYVGTISAVQNAGGKIESFTLKSAGSSLKIYLSPSLYSERLNAKDARNLPTLIAKGKKITIDTYICGASGKIVLAMYILAGIEPNTLG